MSSTTGPEASAADPRSPAPQSSRALRPFWWWFLLQGIAAGAYGLFAIATPVGGAGQFLIVCSAFTVLIVFAGVLLTVQGRALLGTTRGAVVLIVAAAHAFAAAVVFAVLIALGLAFAMFWSYIGFLLLEGALLLIGLGGVSQLRAWRLLMGVCLDLAAVALLALWLILPGDFDAQHIGVAACGILYGAALIFAALQVRRAAFQPQALAGLPR